MKEFVLQDAPHGRHGSIDFAAELNQEQLDVVLQGDGACLVLAGAGSGKTRTITYRVAYLLEQGVQPDELLLLTFTNKASREMLSRVEGLLGGRVSGLWGGTFHSISNRLLRIYAQEIGYTPNFTILDTEDAKDLVKLCVKDAQVDTSSRRFPSPSNLLSIISYARNARRSMRDTLAKKHPSFLPLESIIERIAELYAARKQASDAMDFDDLLLNLLRLMRERPDIGERISRQFRYVLVDEYQDTNAIQAELVRMLSDVHRNILVVGDDAQSIYSFRAADIKNILSFPETHTSVREFRLLTNYRSTPEILAFANHVIEKNQDQFKKDLVSMRASAEKPNVVAASTPTEEARFIAQQVLALREEGVSLNEMAVLFRAAFHSQAVEFEFMKYDIPYEYRGGMKFFERAHIKDVVAHVRLLGNPKDEAAWMRVLGLQQGIGAVTAGRIIDMHVRPFDRLKDMLTENTANTRAARGWETARQLLVKMQAAEQKPGEAIRMVAASAYREYVEAEYPDARDRMEDIEQFARFADGYDDCRSFLDDVSLADEYGASREQADTRTEEKIVLSTIHQAKGLEWDAVFVMHLADGKFPNPRALDEDGGIEEERRLFYVAVTRARTHLFLTYPITSMNDAFVVGAPSMFLQEVDHRFTEEVRLTRTRSATGASVMRSRSDWDNDEGPTIVLDAQGERLSNPSAGRSFLRDIEDL